ncbi:MAG: hypothetical protein KU38_09870 [Sulfurovum sp. FS08-3]|nr:MAG: hypothetical protein KU38_09870 [Sulfurovum sp. FS08-3]
MPPFKYLIESATLGSVISFIRSLKIGNSDIEAEVSRHFNISNAQTFKHYLERLSEIRNRAAHGGRLFNRTFRSASGIGKFQTFRASISTHKALDVALFLHFMLNQLQEYRSFEDFKHKQIAKLFQKLKKDSLSSMESFDLIKKYTKHDTNRIKRKIIERMSI